MDIVLENLSNLAGYNYLLIGIIYSQQFHLSGIIEHK